MRRSDAINRAISDYVRGSGKKLGQIAEEAGLRRDVFSRILHGHRPVYADELMPILRAAGMPLARVLAAAGETGAAGDRTEDEAARGEGERPAPPERLRLGGSVIDVWRCEGEVRAVSAAAWSAEALVTVRDDRNPSAAPQLLRAQGALRDYLERLAAAESAARRRFWYDRHCLLCAVDVLSGTGEAVGRVTGEGGYRPLPGETA